jgi:hypothetical protein
MDALRADDVTCMHAEPSGKTAVGDHICSTRANSILSWCSYVEPAPLEAHSILIVGASIACYGTWPDNRYDLARN